MTDVAAVRNPPTAPGWKDEGVHFLRAVTDMAEHCNVVTGEPIFNDKGVKLVDKGARIDSRMYERLVKHKLRDPIDKHLGVDNRVDVLAIEAQAMVQCETVDLMRRLVQSLDGTDRLLAPLRLMVLPPQIAFKLTVMREQRTELFAHSLQMMLVAVYLGLQSGWSERECGPLATAALLHDVGMLYMDPAWTDPNYRLTGAGRTRSRPCSSCGAQAPIRRTWKWPCSNTTSAWTARAIRAACTANPSRRWARSCCWPKWSRLSSTNSRTCRASACR
jgi:hypothetical protein